MSLAGLSGGLRSVHDDLQSLSSLVSPWRLAARLHSVGRSQRRRHADHRQHHGKSASLCWRWKRGASAQAIGRSRGGRTTKIHAVVDGCGRIIAFDITPGQLGDARAALGLLGSLPPAQLCAADTAYDSNGLRQFLLERGTLPVIPNNPTRKRFHPFDAEAYKRRNIIERALCRLKDWRRIATRYDKLATNFAAAVAIAATIIWWT
jgi:transposase